MNVEIFEHESPKKLQEKINKWIDDQCWDESGEPNKEVVDIKLINGDDGYIAMIIYKFI